MARNPIGATPLYSGYLPTSSPSTVGEHTERYLRQNRADINERVTRETRRSSQIRAEDVMAFIRCDLEPVLESVGAYSEAAVPRLANTALDLAFEAIGQRLLGPRAIQPGVVALWRAFPQLAKHLANDPTSLINDLQRAAIFLATHPNLRNMQWATELARIGSHAASPHEVRLVGQVLAWTQGLPQYRHSALATADQLPPDLALASVGSSPDDDWPTVRDALRADRWFHPGKRALIDHGFAARVGSFSGFDGHFAHPPLVAVNGTSLITWAVPAERSARQSTPQHPQEPHPEQPTVWHLLADAYGSAFIRTQAATQQVAVELPPGCSLDAGMLRVGTQQIDLRAAGPITSAAVLGRTLAVTTERSFRITLVRLPV
jgi:hypothetical protein